MSSVRADRSASRRRAILNATLKLYAEAGPEALSIEAIGAVSGASVGSIYHHFKHKDGVLAALHSQLLNDYRLAIRTRLEAAPDGRAIVRGLVLQHLHWTAENPDAARYLHRMRQSAPVRAGDEELRRSTTAMIRALRKRLGDEVRALPAPVSVALVLGPADHFARHWLSGRTSGLSPAEVSGELADAAWQAVAHQSPTDPSVERESATRESAAD